MAVESIAKTLGTGSGIDIQSLVSQLVDAQYSTKNALLTQKSEKLTAQISSVSSLKSTISSLDSSLKTLVQSGTLGTQPVSSNTGIVKVSKLAGATVLGAVGTIEVRQLASAQVTASSGVSDKTAAIGTGTLTLQFGTATVDEDGAMDVFTPGASAAIDIPIGTADSSLEGIAKAINAKKAGVTASIVTDSSGSRLVLKSATGAGQAFTLTGSSPELAALNVGTGSTLSAVAQDAIVAVDGVAVNRSTNTISDLITGTKLDLVNASPGTKVTLGSEAPTAALTQAVGDFVAAFNEVYAQVRAATDPVTGELRADPAAKSLLRALGKLTTQGLISGAGANDIDTLGEIGVATNRDGTLRLEATKLSTALANSGDKVEAIFKSAAGLSAAVTAIATDAASAKFGLGASEAGYAKAQDRIEDEQEKAKSAAENMRTRLTRQFAGMDSAVSAYKSTQTFLSQQISAWNSND